MASTFELGAGTWQQHPSANSDAWYAPSVVVDAKRDRLVAFGGMISDSHGLPINETWTLALETLQWSRLNAVSTRLALLSVAGAEWRFDLSTPYCD